MSERLYAPGQPVRARAGDPPWHTRVPRYVRGCTGRIVEATGEWPLADDVARGEEEPRVEPVYTVAFAARDLWGEDGGEGTEQGGGRGTHEVTVELWQSYLEPEERA